MTHHKKQTGFTLVELMLSMSFIAVLLLAIAMLILQISSIYNKGITLRSVNESGEAISSDLQRSLNTSSPKDVISVTQSTGGRICIGSTVYAWNKADQIDASGKNKLTSFNQYQDNRASAVRLVKFTGQGTLYCQITPTGYPRLPSDGVTEVLGAGDTNLAIHNLEINTDGDGAIGQAVAGDASQRMYKVKLLLGTVGEKEITASQCTVPETLVDDEYCAVNEFEFIARAGNKSVE